MVDRTKRLAVQISEHEESMLQKLAERAGVSASEYVRAMIRQQYSAGFGGEDLALLKEVESIVLDQYRNGLGAAVHRDIVVQLKDTRRAQPTPKQLRELVAMSNLIEEREGKFWPLKRR